MARQADWLVAEGTPANIANAAWAFVRLGHGGEASDLLDAMERRAAWLVEHGGPHAIANTIERHANWLVAKADPPAITQKAWAFAKLRYPSTLLFAAIGRRSAWLVASSTAGALWWPVRIAWASATRGKLYCQHGLGLCHTGTCMPWPNGGIGSRVVPTMTNRWGI
jgi:hypothetical protein